MSKLLTSKILPWHILKSCRNAVADQVQKSLKKSKQIQKKSSKRKTTSRTERRGMHAMSPKWFNFYGFKSEEAFARREIAVEKAKDREQRQ